VATSAEDVREDVLDGLVSGSAADAAQAFIVERQMDGSLHADFGDDDFIFKVTVEQVPRRG